MNNKPTERPWWFPVLTTDPDWINTIRVDYPEDTAEMTDEEIVMDYGDDQKYATTWDNIGDAHDDYEPLADAYLALLEQSPPEPDAVCEWRLIDLKPQYAKIKQSCQIDRAAYRAIYDWPEHPSFCEDCGGKVMADE